MKKLFLSGLVGVSALFASALPSFAGTCWFATYAGGRTLEPNYCDVVQRVNANGHNVVDVRDHDGTEWTFVFWDDNKVEMIYTNTAFSGVRLLLDWYVDSDGDRRITNPRNGWEMGIAP